MLFCTELFEGDPRLCILVGPPNMLCLKLG